MVALLIIEAFPVFRAISSRVISFEYKVYPSYPDATQQRKGHNVRNETPGPTWTFQIEIMDEAEYEREPGTARVSQHYVRAALGALMPVVLQTLLKQDEDSADDPEHWDLGE